MKDFVKVLRLGKQRDVGMTFCRVEYKGGVLSITGVEGPRANGTCRGDAGQIVMHAWDFVEYAPGFDAAVVERLRQVWADWHLNNTQAGSLRQTAWIKANPRPVEYPQSHYEVYRDALSEAGLNPDTEYLHRGKPYEYGSAWLRVEVPEEVLQFLYDLPDADIQPAWV